MAWTRTPAETPIARACLTCCVPCYLKQASHAASQDEVSLDVQELFGRCLPLHGEQTMLVTHRVVAPLRLAEPADHGNAANPEGERPRAKYVVGLLTDNDRGPATAAVSFGLSEPDDFGLHGTVQLGGLTGMLVVNFIPASRNAMLMPQPSCELAPLRPVPVIPVIKVMCGYWIGKGRKKQVDGQRRKRRGPQHESQRSPSVVLILGIGIVSLCQPFGCGCLACGRRK